MSLLYVQNILFVCIFMYILYYQPQLTTCFRIRLTIDTNKPKELSTWNGQTDSIYCPLGRSNGATTQMWTVYLHSIIGLSTRTYIHHWINIIVVRYIYLKFTLEAVLCLHLSTLLKFLKTTASSDPPSLSAITFPLSLQTSSSANS